MPEEIHVVPTAEPVAAVVPPPASDAEASLGSLFKRLTDDGRSLIHQEIALAKAEVLATAKNLAKGGILIGLGAGMLALGMLVLVAFAVVALGALLGGEYWLSSLIVGGLLSLLGGILVLSGRSGLKTDGLAPQESVRSLRANKAWAEEEIDEIKRDFAT